jgi:acetyl esterase
MVVGVRFGLDALADPRLVNLVADTRAFYARRSAGHGPKSLEELLALRAKATSPAASQPPALEQVLEADGRRVRARIHTPTSGDVVGVLLNIPGGGFYLSSAASDDVRNRRLADALGIAVISVDYRLAPEHPWPAAPHDCETAAIWLAEHADQRFGTTKLAIGGFSAGATLAMTTLLRVRERGTPAFTSAVLQFGTYDLSGQTPAGRLIADEYFLHAYLEHIKDRTNPDISPIYADLTDLPPVLIVVGAEDILLQDNLAMAAALSATGIDVDVRVYPAAPHGFTGHTTAVAQAAVDDMDRWLIQRLGPSLPSSSPLGDSL